MPGESDDRCRELCRAREDGASLPRVECCECSLEELAHDTEREVLLELAAVRDERSHSPGACLLSGGGEQRRLPDAGRSLQKDAAPRSIGGIGKRARNGREFFFSFEKLMRRFSHARSDHRVPTIGNLGVVG